MTPKLQTRPTAAARPPLGAIPLRALALLAALAPTTGLCDTSSFEAALKTHLAAIDRRDWQALEATLTESGSLSLILPNGRFTVTAAESRKTLQAWLADRDWAWSYAVQSAQSHAGTGVAVVQVNYRDKDASGAEYRIRYLLSLVFSKEAGGWRLVHDQNTLLPDRPGP